MINIAQKTGIIAAIVLVFGGTLTFAMTWSSVGFSQGFWRAWLSSFAFCVLCIAPVGGIISLLINKVINAALPSLSKMQQSIVFGLCMAVIMESIMSAVTTANLHGIGTREQFFPLWHSALLAALPIGIVFSVLISVVLIPKLEAFWTR